MLNAADIFDTFRALDEFYWSPQLRSKTFSSRSSYRAEENEKGISLSIDLPGVKSTDVSVQINDRDVKVAGKLRGADFSYSYKLSHVYDPESSTATLEDGVLTLQFAKLSASKTKTIEIKVK
jgi:HSP20 family molecular chaperone IbpA